MYKQNFLIDRSRSTLTAGLIVALCLGGTSCQYSPNRQVKKAVDKKTSTFLTELKRQENESQDKQQKEYNWDEALDLMYEKNETCKRASFRLEDAKTTQKKLWRNFIPSLNASVSDSTSLDNLATSFVDPTFRINSFLSLGNLLNLPKNVYVNRLGTMAAELNEQLVMRSQTVELFKMFEEKRLLELEVQGIQLNEEVAKVVIEIDPTEASSRKKQVKQQYETWKKRETQWLTKVAKFYNVNPGQITFKSSTAPNIRYTSKDLDFYDTQRWGKLQLKLLAMQEMEEESEIRNAYLRYLPRPNLTASAPSLYSNTGNADFSAGDIRLSPSASWRLDTTGTIGNQIRRLKRNKPYEDWEKSRRIKAEVKTLLDGRNAFIETEQEIKNVQLAKKQYIELIRDGLVEQDSETIMGNLQNLHVEEISLNAKIIEISSSYWLLDESWWSKHQRPWKKSKS